MGWANDYERHETACVQELNTSTATFRIAAAACLGHYPSSLSEAIRRGMPDTRYAPMSPALASKPAVHPIFHHYPAPDDALEKKKNSPAQALPPLVALHHARIPPEARLLLLALRLARSSLRSR